MKRLVLCLALPAAIALSVSCSSKQTNRGRNELTPGPGRDDGSQSEASNKKPAIQSEAQAVQVLLTANETEINEGKLGASTATVPEVKRYAEMLVRDHTAANDRLEALIARSGIKPEVTQTSDRLKFDSDSAMGHLKNMTPSMFDRAFMTRQLNLHRSALTLIDQDIARAIVDPDLKAELPSIRATMQKHLDDAQTILDDLPMSSSTSSSSSGGSADASPPAPDFPDAGDFGGPIGDPPDDGGAE